VRFGGLRDCLGYVPARSPSFDFDEGVLPVGTACLSETAVDSLQRMEEIQAERG